jgi:hypothetical protein
VAALLLLLGLFLGAPKEIFAEPGVGVSGGEGPAPEGNGLGEDPDLSAIVGLSLGEVIDRFGAPLAVAAFRGPEPWQDDVVFSYDDGLQLFWYRNRVWQVRLDARFGGRIFRLLMGSSRERVLDTMGEPWRQEQDALVYHLEDRGYPVRLRFYFEEDRLVDVYCYRGDL